MKLPIQVCRNLCLSESTTCPFAHPEGPTSTSIGLSSRHSGWIKNLKLPQSVGSFAHRSYMWYTKSKSQKWRNIKIHEPKPREAQGHSNPQPTICQKLSAQIKIKIHRLKSLIQRKVHLCGKVLSKKVWKKESKPLKHSPKINSERSEARPGW